MARLTIVLGGFIFAGLIAAACGGGSGGSSASSSPSPPPAASGSAQPSGATTPGIASVGNSVTVVPGDSKYDPALLAALALTPEQVGKGATVTKGDYSPDGTSFRVTMHSPQEDVVAQVVHIAESAFPASFRSLLAQLDQLYGDVAPLKPAVGDESYIAVGRPIGANSAQSVVAVSESGLYMAIVSVTGVNATSARATELLAKMAANIAGYRVQQQRPPVPAYAPSPPASSG